MDSGSIIVSSNLTETTKIVKIFYIYIIIGGYMDFIKQYVKYNDFFRKKLMLRIQECKVKSDYIVLIF